MGVEVAHVMSQNEALLVFTSRNLSKRWKVWGTMGKDVEIGPKGSFFAAWKLSISNLDGWTAVRVDSMSIKVLNGRSESGQGEVWLEYWLYTRCVDGNDTSSCEQSAKVTSHVFFLKPDGLVSDLIDISTLVRADESIYILEIRNTSKLTAMFGSIEYLVILCQGGPQGLECIN